MALHEHVERSYTVQVVVVAVLHGGSLPALRRLARTLAAPVCCPARPDDDGRDRIGEDT